MFSLFSYKPGTTLPHHHMRRQLFECKDVKDVNEILLIFFKRRKDNRMCSVYILQKVRQM